MNKSDFVLSSCSCNMEFSFGSCSSNRPLAAGSSCCGCCQHLLLDNVKFRGHALVSSTSRLRQALRGRSDVFARMKGCFGRARRVRKGDS